MPLRIAVVVFELVARDPKVLYSFGMDAALVHGKKGLALRRHNRLPSGSCCIPNVALALAMTSSFICHLVHMPEEKQVGDLGEYGLEASHQGSVTIVEDNRGLVDIVLIEHIFEALQRPGVCSFIFAVEERMGNWDRDANGCNRDETEQREAVFVDPVGEIHNPYVAVVLVNFDYAWMGKESFKPVRRINPAAVKKVLLAKDLHCAFNWR